MSAQKAIVAGVAPPVPTAVLAVLVGVIVFAASIFGIFTRPVGLLAAFWPANALLLGLLLRHPRLAHPLGWACAAAGYVAADMIAGSTWPKTLLLTFGNMAGVAVGYALYRGRSADDRSLRRPEAVLILIGIALAASAAVGLVGIVANPTLFGGSPREGFEFWFVTELVNYIAVLPAVLSFPPLRSLTRRRRRTDFDFGRTWQAAPAVALLASFALSNTVAGPGSLAFPVPALLWCALSYGVFTTALLTLLSSVWILLSISNGFLNLGADFHEPDMLMSLRMGVALISLGPIAVASIGEARNALLARLECLATHDSLTGILNRGGFLAQSSAALAAQAPDAPVTLLMLDIDRFKRINDTHGHPVGDRTLIAFTLATRSCLRDGDLFGRLGGEEFAILLTGCGRDTAEAIAERICRTFAATAIPVPDGTVLNATVSIGATFSAAAQSRFEDLLAQADAALYRAKQAGRNRVEAAAAG
ncbi:MAG: diguanylate cyclase [Alphaproteobacteria bacterium]